VVPGALGERVGAFGPGELVELAGAVLLAQSGDVERGAVVVEGEVFGR